MKTPADTSPSAPQTVRPSNPAPKGIAYVSTRWDRCIGCGACETACSMRHFGRVHRELSRIRVYRYLLPLPKSLPNVCCQCRAEERECQKACPMDPPVISFNEKTLSMELDEGRCQGSSCGLCADACPAEAVRFMEGVHDYPLVCDLCTGSRGRNPQCVAICPAGALEFVVPAFPQHLERLHPDFKAECLARRLYPLPKDRLLTLPSAMKGGE